MPQVLINKYPKSSLWSKPKWLNCEIKERRKHTAVIYVPDLKAELVARWHKIKED